MPHYLALVGNDNEYNYKGYVYPSPTISSAMETARRIKQADESLHTIKPIEIDSITKYPVSPPSEVQNIEVLHSYEITSIMKN